jgi:hypothetical protein
LTTHTSDLPSVGTIGSGVFAPLKAILDRGHPGDCGVEPNNLVIDRKQKDQAAARWTCSSFQRCIKEFAPTYRRSTQCCTVGSNWLGDDLTQKDFYWHTRFTYQGGTSCNSRHRKRISQS